jgi:hypothetical protein
MKINCGRCKKLVEYDDEDIPAYQCKNCGIKYYNSSNVYSLFIKNNFFFGWDFGNKYCYVNNFRKYINLELLSLDISIERIEKLITLL